MKKILSKIFKGLHLDSDKKYQPEGTYSFALNAVTNSKEGERTNLINEEGNEVYSQISEDYILLGSVYVDKNETILFSVKKDESLSEIGLLKGSNYIIIVNTNLDFKIKNQISASYRLRRGCERTLYFVDGLNKPRYFNLDKSLDYKKSYYKNPIDFADVDKHWDIDKFNLFKSYQTIPVFSNIEIEESGTLPSGSYSFAIQYLDEDLNSTEFISHTNQVIIYNDSYSKNFHSIRGSTNLKTDYQDFGNTSKSIRVDVDFLDISYPYYRLAILEANSGTGVLSRVVYTDKIPLRQKSFTYTGNNFASLGTIEEVQLNANPIESAEHIEQIENRLILGNTKGKDVNFCELQKYASRIKADLALQKISLSNIHSKGNPKRGTVQNESVSYTPGEIYSFGVEYIFDDGFVSPVYHIPGRNGTYDSQMSSDNTCTTALYAENDSNLENYWGVDCQGDSLRNTPIRHHRFPLRGEIGLTLITDVGEDGAVIYKLLLNIAGSIRVDYIDTVINYVITYEISGTEFQYSFSIDVLSYNENTDPTGNPLGLPGIEIAESESNDIILTLIEERDSNNAVLDPVSGLTYDDDIEEAPTSQSEEIETEIFGITFSNIEVPFVKNTKSKIVGYNIVRNEKTEGNKTILDTAILLPLLKTRTEDFKVHRKPKLIFGHIFPNTFTSLSILRWYDEVIFNNGFTNSLINKPVEDTFALLHLNHKFNNRQYSNVDEIIMEGEQNLKVLNVVPEYDDYYQGGNVYSVEHSVELTEDAQPGTSYDSSIHRKREKDSDGFTLLSHTRKSYTEYKKIFKRTIALKKQEGFNISYLDALFSTKIANSDNLSADNRRANSKEKNREVYNLSADNRIGIIAFKEAKFTTDYLEAHRPYVTLKKNITNPYSNFRILPYFKENKNTIIFSTNDKSTTTVFNGDSYVSPLQFTNSFYYDLIWKDRQKTRGTVNYVIGVLSVVVGAILTYFAGPVGLVVVGFGLSQLAAGVKLSQLIKVYGDLYNSPDGVKTGVKDRDYILEIDKERYNDDCIHWIHDTALFWFESSVNTNIRMGNTIGLTDFLDPFTTNDIGVNSLDKISTMDPKADGGRSYQGFSKPELYEINKDYTFKIRPKISYHLPFEYSCNSLCREEFPHRIVYSGQSFQEELVDNYRVFLANNYRDIEGSTGGITNLLKIQNNLYIHTEECLWHLPQNFQERITNDIVSFIGTGEFFNIPPRRIVDSKDGDSAGSLHKWGTVKTPYGIFFVSSRNGTIYQFNGSELKPISSKGLFNWSKENLPLNFDTNFYNVNSFDYDYINNPSNEIGTGYVSIYDSEKERILVTKKDFDLIEPKEDYNLCTTDGETIIFNDFSKTIVDEAKEDWLYTGISNCKMQFEKLSTEVKIVEKVSTLPNTTDMHIFYDVSGSFGNYEEVCMQSINNAVNDWVELYRQDNPDWIGNLYKYKVSNERWLRYTDILSQVYFEKIVNGNSFEETGSPYAGENLADKDVLIISFCNESYSSYHGSEFLIEPLSPTKSSLFIIDYDLFIHTYQPSYNSFRGILYPIVMVQDAPNCGEGNSFAKQSQEFLVHSMAAVEGVNFTSISQIDDITNPNPAFTIVDWGYLKGRLQSSISTTDPYEGYDKPGTLKNFGWSGKWDRSVDEEGNVIDSTQFYEDINELLLANKEISEVEVEFPKKIYKEIEGTVINLETINKSWTLSYSLQNDSWTSFHSYLPNMYFKRSNKFFSWLNGNDNVWKHNSSTKFQNFYGNKEKFILEYIAVDNNRETKIFDSLSYTTEAYRYDSENNDFYKEDNVTFNKGIFYTQTQATGEVGLLPKDKSNAYLENQIKTNSQILKLENNQKEWNINELRDFTNSLKESIFIKNIDDLQTDYFIDKIINTNKIDFNKPWFEIEPLKGKYLAVRLIFDTFDDVKLIFSNSEEVENISVQ